ncbi:MAG: aminotransferase class V-fold PLP-dependent enzyme [Deltaproteobacteria bacterium]|nr:aminotransferase class V-fold PLP-dependent enzyme [Deltaproteobacteria bacterium]
MDWRTEWHDFEGVAYLNAAAQAPMPRAAIRAVEDALEWKKFPHRMPDEAYFEIPHRVRTSLARLIGGAVDEIALTTGAGGGLQAVAHDLAWRPGDEVLIARGEFPAHFATWMPLAATGQLTVRVVEPRDRFVAAEDFLGQIGPRTRLVSASLVRFDDGALLDAPRVAAACHAVGAYLLLDVSQCAGAVPMDVTALGADFLVCAGYKWLLGPYGTGFLWARAELIEEMRVGPFGWMALDGAAEFHKLTHCDWKPVRGARRWDAPEVASFLNLAATDASLAFLLRVGVGTVAAHCARLVAHLVERLPPDKCVLASPADAAARGPYVCIAAHSSEDTTALYQRLRAADVIVSLREGALRVAPHLYNSEQDIERLLAVAAG